MLESTGTLLVVAHEDVRYQLEKVLEVAGYKTVSASSIDDAVSALERQRIDLVIMDETVLGPLDNRPARNWEFVQQLKEPLFVLAASTIAAMLKTVPRDDTDTREFLTRIRAFPGNRADSPHGLWRGSGGVS
jgi:CheY-like chemotaxis protein